MTPKQEKFLIAKFHELTNEIKQLKQSQNGMETFLISRAGYNPPPLKVTPPAGGAPLAGAIAHA